jgi:hypothetical protein
VLRKDPFITSFASSEGDEIRSMTAGLPAVTRKAARVTLAITGVTQDEPLNGLGDGDASPDAAPVPGHADQVRLRAERSGPGDGRVYRLAFGGDDGRGGTCSATLNTTVVKSQGHGTAVDSGLVGNSF